MVFVGKAKKDAKDNDRRGSCPGIVLGGVGSDSVECRCGKNSIDNDVGHFVEARYGGKLQGISWLMRQNEDGGHCRQQRDFPGPTPRQVATHEGLAPSTLGRCTFCNWPAATFFCMRRNAA